MAFVLGAASAMFGLVGVIYLFLANEAYPPEQATWKMETLPELEWRQRQLHYRDAGALAVSLATVLAVATAYVA